MKHTFQLTEEQFDIITDALSFFCSEIEKRFGGDNAEQQNKLMEFFTGENPSIDDVQADLNTQIFLDKVSEVMDDICVQGSLYNWITIGE